MYSINDGPTSGAVESIETWVPEEDVAARRFTQDEAQLDDPRSGDPDSEPPDWKVISLEENDRVVLVNGQPRRATAQTLEILLEDESLRQPPEEVIPNIAAIGRLSMLAAREKIGKTTLLAWCAAQVTLGYPIFGAETVRGSVLWVGLEEALGDAVRRFEAMKGDVKRLQLVTDLPAGEALEQLCAEILYVRPRLVIIDSLAAYATSKEDENSATGWTQILQPMAKLARETKTAIVIVHHASRSSGAYRGSTAIGAAMDMIVEMYAEEGDDSARRLEAKGRWKVEPKTRIRYESTSESFSSVTTGDIQARRVQDLESEILDYVRAQGRAGKESIRKAVPGANARIDEAIVSLTGAGKLVHIGPREGYKLPFRALDVEERGAAAVDQPAE